ncbi:MAG: LUD domain-containing protein [Tannerellaceae bacterium]|nr:LUD domain-containing protein [Tannerellaceae bacterium]
MSRTVLLNTFIRNARAAGAETLFYHKEEDIPLDKWPNLLDFTNPEVAREYQNPADDPERWDKLPEVLFPGQFGVAENGAIWLDDGDLPHRILPFITPHLILKLKTSDIIADMQQAYDRLAVETFGFGVFISGPSKTADIEQSLVYGAHGAREMTVILFD